MKKILCITLALTLLLAALPLGASAEDTDAIRASDYYILFSASLAKGTTGHLKVTYNVLATHTMTTVGINRIIVRNNNGSLHQILYGSTANGLLKSNSASHSGTYTLSNLFSGNIYYCNVQAIAKDANGSETHTITTARVTCP